MKAVVHDRYGPPERLHLREIPMPEIADDGVLVRVKAASVNAGDWREVVGRPLLARLQMGVRRPKQGVIGADVAGVVEAVGTAVTELKPGDEVLGARSGSFAEFVAGRARNFALKPGNISFEEAAAIPIAAITALQGLRDHGGLQAGQRVLIIGAGGGVGTYAVQLAKVIGAHVTAVTSASHLEMVRSLGPDVVLEHAAVGSAHREAPFDLVVDVGGYRRVRDLQAATRGGGICVLIGAGGGSLESLASRIVAARLRGIFLHQRTIFYIAKIRRDDLLYLAELAGTGQIRAVIERTYPLSEAAAAVALAASGHVGGKVVVAI